MHSESLIPYIMEGMVIAVDDPDQMGKVKIWIPSIDGENYNVDDIPWADYASPFAGFTVDYPGGTAQQKNESQTAYGLWAIPKLSSTVFVFFLYGDPFSRYYFAGSLRLHRNRSLPAGRNFDKNGNPGPFGDAEDESGAMIAIQPAYSNLREQFQNKMTASETITRGGYERQVAQQKFDKDGKEGYSASPADSSYLDSQTYCLVTPGRHAIIFQDEPSVSRVRIKTGEGQQIILDDANERIYISTAKGKSWIEMDEDGHINIFAADSMSVRSGKDINFFADGNINLEADQNVNVKANKGNISTLAGNNVYSHSVNETRISSCSNLHLRSNASTFLASDSALHINSKSNLNLTASGNTNLLSSSSLLLSAGAIHLNGPKAASAVDADCAEKATGPSIVPGHEPWNRPSGGKTRNKHWRA